MSNKFKFPNLLKCKTYLGDILDRDKNIIFVFGSNTEGRHGAGAALTAKNFYGAKYGQPRGLQGNSYAIITKDLRTKIQPSISSEEIINQYIELFSFASEMPKKEFKIAYRNVGSVKSLCGYSGEELMLMVEEALQQYGTVPENIFISNEWYQAVINDYMQNM